MESEDIDGAALAADVERHLHEALPAVGAEPPDHELDKRGVIGVEKPVARLAVPGESHVEARAEHGCNAVEDADA